MSLNFSELEKAVLEQAPNIQSMDKEQLLSYFSSVGLLSALYQNQTLKIANLFDQVSTLLSDKSQSDTEITES